MFTRALAPGSRASLIDRPPLQSKSGTARATGQGLEPKVPLHTGERKRRGLLSVWRPSIDLSSLPEIWRTNRVLRCAQNCTVTVQMDQERTRSSKAGPLLHAASRG